MVLCFFPVGACSAQGSSAFYEGLLCTAVVSTAPTASVAPAAPERAAAFFEKALNSPNPHVRAAAAQELGALVYRGVELPPAVLPGVRREAAGSWRAVFDALDAAPDKEKALAALLASGGGFSGEAELYLLRECNASGDDFFDAAERAAIEGHFLTARSRFREALVFFRALLDANAAPENSAPPEMPGLFLKYPALLNDLGRCFQYADSGGEGIELFLEWERALAAGENDARAGGRFRLLFFAGRIARQRGRAAQGTELFSRALPFAPDSVQADSCIWYILDSALSGGSQAAIRQFEIFAPQWHDAAYFSDLLDKLSRELVSKRQWKELTRIFPLIAKYADAGAMAQYAFITGRALQEGFFSTEEIALAEKALVSAGVISPGKDQSALSSAFLRIAYNAGAASFYYRAQSAAALGKPFLELPKAAGKLSHNKKTADNGLKNAAMEFLLGFFKYKAAEFAPRWIQTLASGLPTDGLRVLAAALAEAGLYADSLKLANYYTSREAYQNETDAALMRRDLELCYPQPYRETVRRYAKEYGIPAALLFGLIRTESAFQSDAASSAGAQGLTQLMPATAAETAARIQRGGGPDYAAGGGPNLLDPETNIHIGAAYLAYLLERMGEPPLALLAYNGGMSRVRRWLSAGSQKSKTPPPPLPLDLFLETVEYPETRAYGRKVLGAQAVYEYLFFNNE
jgi:soluble lytic murein transglycosylase